MILPEITFAEEPLAMGDEYGDRAIGGGTELGSGAPTGVAIAGGGGTGDATGTPTAGGKPIGAAEGWSRKFPMSSKLPPSSGPAAR